MSQVKIKQPIVHIPSFKEYKISGLELAGKYIELGTEIPFPRSDNWYYYTDIDGWAKLIPHLLIKSSLYKPDRFDCEDYAMKAQTLCAELFGLNTLRYTYGTMPLGAHGFNSFYVGDGFLLFEPNSGFSVDPVFEIGEYQPISVLL